MKASIIISSYNYEDFICNCIESALAQSYKDIEIIVVDDGSKDSSVVLLQKEYGSNPRVKVVTKENGGQLSVFNTALELITGNIVFFLDADDLYEENYLEKCIDFYQTNSDCEFLYVDIKYFGNETAQSKPIETGCQGFSIYRTFFLRQWIGAPTTAISMKTEILKKILPLKLEEDWRIRADDCLVFGASLVGAKKYSLAEANILYRIHGTNSHFGKKFSNDYYYKREIAINRLFDNLLNKNNMILNPDLITLEYKSLPSPTYSDFIAYLKIAFKQNRPFILTLKQAVQLLQMTLVKNRT